MKPTYLAAALAAAVTLSGTAHAAFFGQAGNGDIYRIDESSGPDIILMAITSQLRPTTTVGEVALQHWNSAGLIKPSVLKPLLATVERRLVIRKMGSLRDDDLAALRDDDLAALRDAIAGIIG